MNRPRPFHRGFAAALAAVLAATLPSPAAVLSSGWPQGPGDGLRAATLAAGEVAADLSIEPGRTGDLFLAWTEASGNTLRVQRLSDSGNQAFGASGTVVRTGTGLSIASAGSRRPGDARGPFDLFPTTDGGVIVLWTELSGLGRELRVQRLGAAGAPVLAPGGVTFITGLEPAPDTAAAAYDGADGAVAAAVTNTNGQGVLRFNRLRGVGSLDYPAPGLPVDTSVDPKKGPAVAVYPGSEAAVCWHRSDGNGLRLQVVAASGPRLAADGMVLGPTEDGAASLRAAGSTIPGSMLIAYRAFNALRVQLVTSFGTVLRNEEAGAGTLAAPPVITAVHAVVNGLPEGIEVKGLLADGTAVEYVRSRSAGTWNAPVPVASPLAPSGGADGALGGPGWVFDAGPSGTTPQGRVAVYRQTFADPLTLDPGLGPWLALAPGDAPFLRVADAGLRVFSAWTAVSGSLPVIVAARAGAFGGQDIVDARGLVARSVKVTRPNSGLGKFTVKAPAAVLPADADPDTGAAEQPSAFRVRAGSERGAMADLGLVSWKGSRTMGWQAKVSGGGVTGTVKAGPSGRSLKISLQGVPTSPVERVAWIRIDLEDRARAATVPLAAKGKSGSTGTYRGP